MSRTAAARFLLMTADPAFAQQLSELLASRWPEANLKRHDPHRDGRLPEGFVAAGFDAVLFDAGNDPRTSGEWLRDLASRAEFAPVIVFGPVPEPLAKPCFDLHVFAREAAGQAALLDCLRDLSRRRRLAQSLARSRANADAKYRFGSVTIRGHRPLRLIAQGSASSVYLAECERLGDLVALKVLERVPDRTGDLRDFERFLDEYQILAGLDHPNIVSIHDIGVADDHLFIAMEYFPQGSLRTRMREPMPAAEAL